MTIRTTLIGYLALVVLTSPLSWADSQEIQRTPDGKPNFTGTFNAATLTPLERPLQYEEQVFLTDADVERIAAEERALMRKGNAPSSANREAPAIGGDALVGFEDRREEAEALGAGNVGGYNVFWFDRGDTAFSIDGKFRTSIITDPPNGRRPPMHPRAEVAYNEYVENFMRNDGTAWWVGRQGPGPYDDPELRPPAERCLLGFVGGPPTLPSLYNNYVRIVQTPDNIMIMNEMIHDARIVRLNDKHASNEVRTWLGDSIGWWEGDTLVIETTNFRDDTGLDGASGSLKVTERLTVLDRDHLQYSFTVDDPNIWTSTWSGDYVWTNSNEHIYEYACHEGNYALGGIMRGARVLEADAESESGTE